MGRLQPQRGNPHRLPGAQPVIGLGPAAVDAQFAFANDPLNVRERKPRKPRLEEPVETHTGFIRADRHDFDPPRLRGGGVWLRRRGGTLARLALRPGRLRVC